jgi:predicted metal-dependent enzyme (double-stranded beta helix superfamily)
MGIREVPDQDRLAAARGSHVPPPPSGAPRPLAVADLRELVAELVAAPERWSALVRHDPERRVFECVLDEPHVEAWLICWMPGHDTGFHDHDLSSGAVTVVAGDVREERLGIGAGVSSAIYGAGEAFDFEASDIHRVAHAGTAPAVTLHVYSPRLRRMGAYAFARDGALKRHPLAYGEELRPLEAA